jgi:hypothetical protein
MSPPKKASGSNASGVAFILSISAAVSILHKLFS